MCGPALELSAGLWICGLAQVVAHQRVAYLGNSHIFTQPPLVRDSLEQQ
jgi:hypothetical protein